MTKNIKNNKALTLLEILIVLAIIGLLIAIAIPTFRGVINRARDSAIKTTLARTREAGTTFFRANGNYQGFCQFSPDWHRIRNALIHEHQVSAERIHCLDSAHFFIVSSDLHTAEVYWIVDSHGRNSAGSSVRGLVGYWRFYEGAGLTAHDSSGQDNHGDLRNFARPHGWVDNAISFDGTNDFIVVPSSPSLTNIALSYTVEIWIRPEVDDDFWTGVVGKAGRNYNFWLGASNSAGGGFVHHRFRTTVSTNDGSPDTPWGSIPMNTWSHVVLTNDGTIARTFINGVQKAERNFSPATLLANDTPLNIGRNLDQTDLGPTAWNTFRGLIDDVRVYNRALSAEEIRAQFEDGRWRKK